MAYHYLVENVVDLDVDGLEAIVAPLIDRLTVKDVIAKELIEQIHQRSGILVEQAIERFGFAHRALHAYLAASYIHEEEKDEVLLQHVAEEGWREVILIAAGLVPPARAAVLLKSLLDQGERDEESLIVAGWSLAEDVQITEDLRADIKRSLLNRLTQAESEGAFGRLAGALMVADFDAAREWMSDILRGGDPQLRRRVLGLIPELGESQGAPLASLLMGLLKDSEEEASLRAQAAWTLPELRVEPDAAFWEALRSAREDPIADVKAAATWAWCEFGRYDELGLVPVPAGEFLMGSETISSDERPQHTLYLPTFYVGKYPVTVAQFRAFVKDSGHEPRDKDSLRSQDNHPVVNVTWHDALVYAQWHGMILPSEAEWEKAARGTDGREYPWGNERQSGRANTSEYWGVGRKLLRRSTIGGTTRVGQLSPAGDSPYGCADMAGNVWEWTRSQIESYPYDTQDGREALDTPDEVRRVLRGGSFLNFQDLARCAFRYRDLPDYWDRYIGFRVAASPFSQPPL